MRRSSFLPEAVMRSADSIAATREGGTRSRRPITRRRTPSVAHFDASLRRNSSSKLSSETTSLAGRFQLFEEKAYRVRMPIPSEGADRTMRRTAATPARCPSDRGNPRDAAQRPLPSSRMATCNFVSGITVKVLLFIKYQCEPFLFWCCYHLDLINTLNALIPGKDSKKTPLALARGANQSLHVIEIFLQGPPPGRRQAVFRLGQPVGEGFCARDVASVLEFPRVDAQIAV